MKLQPIVNKLREALVAMGDGKTPANNYFVAYKKATEALKELQQLANEERNG